MNRMFWYWLALLGAALAVFALDQLAKGWVLTNLAFGQSVTPIPALEGYFALTLSANKGAAFSLLPQFGDIFLIIALVMIVGILLFYHRTPSGHWLERIALGILLGGVCGNALDRLRFGYVIDWFHVRLPGVVSNVSNFADHAIVLSIMILLVAQWRQEQKHTSKTPPAQSQPNPPSESGGEQSSA
ncbi:MAG: signal peptidase II [Anaerolineae bacterium]